MLRLQRIFKNYEETGSFNEQVNLYGFVDSHVFLTKTGDLGATNNGQDAHLDTACVGLDLSNYATAPSATFQLVAPTAAGDPVAVAANSDGGYDVAGLIAKSGVTAAAQGYHVRVDAGGKTKVFWVATGAQGCDSSGPGVGGPGVG